MKRFALLIALLCALTANAQATDIVIAASQQTALSFNPSNIGSDRSIVATVTNGSPTVTSAALFPSNIVGKSGFTVQINSVNYTVAGVASTSSLTLTTNYSGSSGPTTITLFKYVLWRVYATQSFQPLGASYIVQAGAPGSGNFYKEVAVSIINTGSGNVAHYPEITLPATTDAPVVNTARYIFGFYRPDGSFIAFYQCGSLTQLQLPAVTPTTMTAICAFNSAGGIAPSPNTYYTAAQIDQRFASCTANQIIYAAATGQNYSCLTVGAGLTIAGGVLSASGSGAIVNPGSVNQLAYYSGTTAISGLNLGANFAIAAGALKAQAIREAINVKLDYGCAGDGVTSDQTCIANAITAAASAGTKAIYLPGGTYLVTGLTLNGQVEMFGDGDGKSIIYSTSNAAILTLGPDGNFRGPTVRDLTVRGSVSAGGSQNGLVADDGTYVHSIRVQNVSIENTGNYGLYVGNAFSSSFENMFITNTANYNLLYYAANMPQNRFSSIYVGDLRSGVTSGFRIRRGEFTCYNCNGVNTVVANSWWATIGDKTGTDGSLANVAAFAHWIGGNAESTVAGGIRHYFNSSSIIDGMFQFAGDASGSGSYIALLYEVDSSLFPPQFSKGTIGDRVTFAQSPASYYANSEPIHSNDLPPLMTDGQGPRIAGGSHVATYRDTTNSRSEPLTRADGFLHTFTVTSTANGTFNRPGVRYIEANCGSACTITLPWPGWYREKEPLIVKDVSGAASSNNITLQAASGGTINGSSSLIMTLNGQAVYLIADGSADWRVITNTVADPALVASGALSANVYPFAAGANTLSTSTSPISNFSGSLLISGSMLMGTDNTYDFGGASDNRLRDLYIGRKVRLPDGAVGTPSLARNSDATTGLWFDANGVNLANAGTNRARTNSGGFEVFNTLSVGTASSAAGSIVLRNASNSNTLTLSAGTTSGSYTLTFPATPGAGTECLQMSSAGVITTTGSACGGSGSTPGGADTNVQFNDGGAFGGDADYTWNKTGNVLTIAGHAAITQSDTATVPFSVQAVGASTAEMVQFKDSGGTVRGGFATSGAFFLRQFTVAPSVSLANDVKCFYDNTGGVTDNQFVCSKNTGQYNAVVVGNQASYTSTRLARWSGTAWELDDISGATSDGTNVTYGSGNLRATSPRFTTAILDSNGNELIDLTATGSAVNQLTLANSATGNAVTVGTAGSDSNINLNFAPKGSGVVQIGGVTAATISSTQTFTNKTLTSATNVLGGVTMTLGSDADGDMYYRASNVLTRLAKGTAGQCLQMNGGATAPVWGSCGAGSPGGSDTQVQRNNAGNFGGISGFTSDGTNVTAGSGNLRATRPRFTTSIDDANGNESIILTATGSAVNEITLANAATGGIPSITASGGDTDVSLRLNPKGDGGIGVGVDPLAMLHVKVGGIGTGIQVDSASGAISGVFTSDGSTFLAGTSTNHTLEILTNGTTRLTVSGSGAIATAGGTVDFGASTSFKTAVAAGGAPTANGTLIYDSTANILKAGVNGATVELSLYDVSGSVVAKPGVSQVVLRFVAPRAFTLLTGTISNGTNAPVKAAAAATAQADFTVAKNGVTFCTLRWAAAATQAVYQSCTATDFASGDVLTITAPSSQDATLSDVGFTLPGKLK
jgi:hypothetical protein